MASIIRKDDGRRMIQFIASDGRRRTVRLGKVPQRTAEAVKVRIEKLVAASITSQALDDETGFWVAGLDQKMARRLAAAGLVAKREAAELGPFLDSYIASRADVKSTTATVYGHTRRNLVEHFGVHKAMREITAGDADEWRIGLVKQGLADNTVRRRKGVARQFFKAAVRRKLITSNPFDGLAAGVRANTSRFYYLSREHAQRILDACPDAQWRLMFALARFGGLRCPSELLALRWADVDWEHGRMTVRSSKTEHHAGGESRLIPLFPELLPHLREAFEEAEPGTEHVITAYRDPAQNLRTQFGRILRRAGLKPWPKLFQNLRSTRETELAESWPLHVVCAWIGNSQPVAAKHYLQVTDDHFERAALQPETALQPTGCELASVKALQKALQHTAVLRRTASHAEQAESTSLCGSESLRDGAVGCELAESSKWAIQDSNL